MQKANVRANPTPGEILLEEFLKPMGLSQNSLARSIRVPPRRINEIVMEKRSITADTVLRLGRYFGAMAEMWAGLQADYDLRLARYEKERQIERDIETAWRETSHGLEFPFFRSIGLDRVERSIR